MLQQAGVYLAQLEPKKGLEIGKKRPVILMTSQILLDKSPPLVFVCPLSSQSRSFKSLHIEIQARDSLLKKSYALVEHMRAISTKRIDNQRRLTLISNEEYRKISERLHYMIELNNLSSH